MRLDQLTVREFIEELGSGSATPGGGSAAALCGAMGAALSAMVAKFTGGREKFRDVWARMEGVKQGSEELARHFLALAQEDTAAYQKVLDALRLPKEAEEEKTARGKALQKALKEASGVPLETLRLSERLIGIANDAVEHGNPETVTDAAGAVHLAHAAATVAAYNVRINLSRLKEAAFVEDWKREVGEILERIEVLRAKVDRYVNARLA